MNHLPRTDTQQRLDAELDALFGVGLAAIKTPLSLDEMAEGDECAERR